MRKYSVPTIVALVEASLGSHNNFHASLLKIYHSVRHLLLHVFASPPDCKFFAEKPVLLDFGFSEPSAVMAVNLALHV